MPAWWLRNAHLQTLWASVVRRAEKPVLRRERLELPDGDFIDLDWTAGASGPVVIVLHGLQGSSNSGYARGILSSLHQHGYRAVLMHFRGCSGEPNRLPRFYHGGDTGDLDTLVNILRAREPHTPLAAVGYSLGGNVLLKWLGAQGHRAPLSCAVAVSVPFEMNAAALRLQCGFSRIYQRHLLHSLRNAVHEKSKRMRMPLDFGDLERLRTLRAYDDAITAPLHGFAGVDDYYAQSSCRQYLGRIGIPTLVLHAADDPFLPRTAIPSESELPPHVTLELSEHGGHVGFVNAGSIGQPRYWLEERIPEFLRAVLDINTNDRQTAEI